MAAAASIDASSPPAAGAAACARPAADADADADAAAADAAVAAAESDPEPEAADDNASAAGDTAASFSNSGIGAGSLAASVCGPEAAGDAAEAGVAAEATEAGPAANGTEAGVAANGTEAGRRRPGGAGPVARRDRRGGDDRFGQRHLAHICDLDACRHWLLVGEWVDGVDEFIGGQQVQREHCRHQRSPASPSPQWTGDAKPLVQSPSHALRKASAGLAGLAMARSVTPLAAGVASIGRLSVRPSTR